MGVSVNASGPLFSGRLEGELLAMRGEVVDAVAELAHQTVEVNLAGSLKNPTGFYQRNIAVEHPGLAATAVVTDSMVIYGPWLEGLGSRNATTRFKGYWSFRRAAQNLNTSGAVQALAAAVVARHLAAMG